MSEMMILEPRRQLADVTRDIRIKTGQFLLDAIEIGRLLYEAKAMVEPGGWMDYVEREVPFSQSWANNYMRLYKEYGSEQLSIFGNSQATARLSPTQALELLALPAQEREEFMETHDVENMSTRELKQAIRERDEAVQAQEAAEAQVEENRTEITQLKADLEKAQQAQSSAAEEVEKLKTQLSKAKEKAKAAKDALDKAKENPEIPEALMEEMRQQVAADAAKEATEDLQKKLDEANAAKDAADKARADAEQKLNAAEKAAKLANPDTAVLQVLSKRFLDEFNSVHRQLVQVQQTDPETGKKLKAAIIETIDQMRGMIVGNEG